MPSEPFVVDPKMSRISIVLIFVLLAGMTGAMMATQPNFAAKAEIPNGVISVAFDDNYLNQFLYAFPLLEEYGIEGTFYIRTDRIDQSGYMTSQQLQILQSNGNEIGSHSHTHRTFTSLSETEIRSECSVSKQILEGKELMVNNFAYPNGPTDDFVDSIVSDYYRSGRTAYIEPYLVDAPTSQFRLAGFSAETEDSTALSLLKGMVDQVEATNSWAIIFFHNVIPDGTSQPYTTSTEDFESFLDYIITKGVETLTVNQVLDLASLSIWSNFGTVSPISGIYNLGETITIEAVPPSSVEGERYVWLGWTGSGAGSYTGFDNPASITFNGPINQTGLWRHEFELSIQADFGVTSPSSGKYWYEAGSSVNIEAVPPSSVEGERYVWLGWKGIGLDSYSGSSTAASVVMNSAITQEASWTHQFQISIVISGIGSDISESMIAIDGLPYVDVTSLWLNSGAHDFEFVSTLEVNSVKRYVWEVCSGLASQRYGAFFAYESDTLSANYKTQFALNVISPYGDSVGTGWYDSGSTAYAILNHSVETSSDIRQLFTGWSENASGNNLTSDPIIMDGPKSATAIWKTQFLIVFNQTGLPNDYEATILVDSVNHNLPFSFWADDGLSINFAYPDRLQNGFIVYYFLENHLDQSLEADSSTTITALYSMEYDFGQVALLLVPAILISFVVVMLIWRRRKKPR